MHTSEKLIKNEKKTNLSESHLPVFREICFWELITTVVSNKGSQAKTSEVIEELTELIKLRTEEAINLSNNTMSYIIDEVRSYE
jgi:endonuclease III